MWRFPVPAAIAVLMLLGASATPCLAAFQQEWVVWEPNFVPYGVQTYGDAVFVVGRNPNSLLALKYGPDGTELARYSPPSEETCTFGTYGDSGEKGWLRVFEDSGEAFLYVLCLAPGRLLKLDSGLELEWNVGGLPNPFTFTVDMFGDAHVASRYGFVWTTVSSNGLSVTTESWMATDPITLLYRGGGYSTAVLPGVFGGAVLGGILGQQNAYTDQDWAFFSLPGSCGPSPTCWNHGVYDLAQSGSPWCPTFPLPTEYGVEGQLRIVAGNEDSWPHQFVGITRTGRCTDPVCIEWLGNDCTRYVCQAREIGESSILADVTYYGPASPFCPLEPDGGEPDPPCCGGNYPAVDLGEIVLMTDAVAGIARSPIVIGFTESSPRASFIADLAAGEVNWFSSFESIEQPALVDLEVDRDRWFAYAVAHVPRTGGLPQTGVLMWDLDFPGVEVPLWSHSFDLGSGTTGRHLTVGQGGSVYVVGEPGFLVKYSGVIDGLVTDQTSSLPVAGVEVHVFDEAGAFVDSTTTDAAGVYSIDGLDLGTYYARTYNPLGYIDERYNDQSCAGGCTVTDGTPIIVLVGQNGQASRDIDFSLARQPCGPPVLGVNFPPSSDPQSFVDGCAVQINGDVAPDWPFCLIDRVEWDWGDGTVEDSWFPASHTYSPGLSTATVAVTAFDTGGAPAVETGMVDLDLILSNQTVSETETFTACNSINATNFAVVRPTGKAAFVAGASIALGEGFRVEVDCEFTATVTDPPATP